MRLLVHEIQPTTNERIFKYYYIKCNKSEFMMGTDVFQYYNSQSTLTNNDYYLVHFLQTNLQFISFFFSMYLVFRYKYVYQYIIEKGGGKEERNIFCIFRFFLVLYFGEDLMGKKRLSINAQQNRINKNLLGCDWAPSITKEP
ncbi:hypothetical protein ABEB36_004692 [Hypothenemus hampei]|uniref:Transmembrane protein n=1 Tax=Hypothenemus hampei TaxID=57062 RepID=A0ABD1F449_HYPHA